MIIGNEQDVTAAVLAELQRAPDPRFKEIMGAAVRHLHGFVRDARKGQRREAGLLRRLQHAGVAHGQRAQGVAQAERGGGLVEGDETTGRAMMHLAEKHRANLRIVDARDARALDAALRTAPTCAVIAGALAPMIVSSLSPISTPPTWRASARISLLVSPASLLAIPTPFLAGSGPSATHAITSLRTSADGSSASRLASTVRRELDSVHAGDALIDVSVFDPPECPHSNN